jgi:iron-only hydrogenase group A
MSTDVSLFSVVMMIIPLENTAGKMVPITINGRHVEAEEGSSLLEACEKAGIFIPKLCYHPALESVGTCRLCLVDVKGMGKLQPSCMTKVASGIEVVTENPEILEAVRANLRLLRSRHPNDCMTCEVNGRCEFQDLLYRFQIEDKYDKMSRIERKEEPDLSSPSLVRDMDKCVLCGRCVRVCASIQGMNILAMVNRGSVEIPETVFELPLNSTQCINCGQCATVCPVGAIIEVPHIHDVIDALKHKDDRIIIASTAPAVRVAISEEFGLPPGSISTGHMVAALRKCGFDKVFDTNFAADLTTVEEANEFIARVKAGGPFPMFTSCCPAWINMVEKIYPELIPNISSCRSPQAMMGSLVKTFYAKEIGVAPEKIVLASIMPCTAKKDEIQREQLAGDTDYVLTTRELAKLFRLNDVNFVSLEESDFDAPLGLSTGAAAIFGATGGVMESALRTAYETITGKSLPSVDLNAVRGLEGIRDAVVDVEGLGVKVAVANGGANVRKLIEKVLAKEVDYHFIEIMECRGGCVGGGGEPKSMDKDILSKRIGGIYKIDHDMKLRKAHDSPAIKEIYENFLGKPNSHIAHELLHTHYHSRKDE